MKQKIYLSAPALVCCAGQNRNELYESCLTGYQGGLVMSDMSSLGGISPHAINSGGKYPVGLVSQGLPEAALEPAQSFDTKANTENTKIIRIINAALEQLRPAVEKAIAQYGPRKIGVCLGSCDIGSEASLLAHRALCESKALSTDYNFCFQFQSASLSTEFIMRKFGISGPALTVATACASGSSAIVRGAELIRAGHCDAVIAGGADIVTETVFAGFRSLEAVSDSLTNPFSKNRKGINLGEGAAFFLLESAKNSGVELLGTGESSDAYHMTAPGMDGTGPAQAMHAALLDAGISPDRIGYVNLHGTGTGLNDKAEALAMQMVFRALPPVSSTKPITGHTLGAAGALEAAICWMVLHEQRGLPVHCWDGIRDEELPFSPVDGPNRETPSICMSNSFGFGGCNVSLILGRCDDQ